VTSDYLRTPSIINIIIAIPFVAMAAIQYNDPDPLYWFVAYAGTAWVVATSGTRLGNHTITSIALGLVGAGLLISAPGFLDYLASGSLASIAGSMQGPHAHVEPAREFLGLLIALAALLHYARRSGRAPDHSLLDS
jgi:hypothetical protein